MLTSSSQYTLSSETHTAPSHRPQQQAQPAGDFDFSLHPARPLLHFGKPFAVRLSTAVSFDLETVLEAAIGHSLADHVKRTDYAGHLALRAWMRSVTQGSKMQRATRALLDERMSPVNDIARPPTIEEVLVLPNALAGCWRGLFRMARIGRDTTLRRMLVRLAARDRQLHALAHMDAGEQAAARIRLFQDSIRYWVSTGLFDSFRPIVLLDATLEHLAWADVQLSRSKDPTLTDDPIAGFVKPDKVPMRHWFDRLLNLTGTSNLAALCDLLAEQAHKDNPRNFTHLELKQWATASKRMTPRTAYWLVATCHPEGDQYRELIQLCAASLMTFLVSFVQACATAPVSQAVAQAAIHQRLTALRDTLLATDAAQRA